jgi:ribosomal protein L19E
MLLAARGEIVRGMMMRREERGGGAGVVVGGRGERRIREWMHNMRMMRDMLRWSTTTGPKMRVRKESMLTIQKMDQMTVQALHGMQLNRQMIFWQQLVSMILMLMTW